MHKRFNSLLFVFTFYLVGAAFGVVEGSSGLNLQTYEDVILWHGYGTPKQFDPNLINESPAKKKAFEKGLKTCEEKAREGSLFHQETLASHYYYTTNEFKKGLYWANASAELGSSMGMDILASAFIQGKGVVQDGHEAFKWLFLAVAAGNENAANILKEARAKDKDFDSGEFVETCKQSARDWVRAHPKAFFDPN